MRCPNCGSLDTQVKDSRPTEDSAAIRRRRVCLACDFRFTTFERVQLRELVVIKRNGRRVPFDRDKLARSVQISLRKRPVDPERVEQFVSSVVRELESLGESDVTSETIGELVMERLRALDDVAYVRFASVYRNFREPKDFEEALAELSGEDERPAPRWPQDPRPQMNRPAALRESASDTSRTCASCALRSRSAAAGSATPGPTRPWAPSWSRTGSSSAAAGRSPAGGPHAETEALKRAGRGSARRNALCHARALLASRPDAALRRCDPARGHRARGHAPAAIRTPRWRGRAMRRAARGRRSLVEEGLCADEARRDHAGHIRRMTRWPAACAAQARRFRRRQGRGRRAASPSPITGEAARTRVHLMRAQSDAILVGIGTVLADNPMLNCRLPGMEDRSPVRVVLDAQAAHAAGLGRDRHGAGCADLGGLRASMHRTIARGNPAGQGRRGSPRRGRRGRTARSATGAGRRWPSAASPG